MSRIPHLFLVMQSDLPFQPPARYSLADLEIVTVGRGARRSARRSDRPQETLRVAVADEWMSSIHFELAATLGRWVVRDVGSKNGTLRNGMPITQAMLKDGDTLAAGHSFFIYRDSLPTFSDEARVLEGSGLDSTPAGLRTLLPLLSREFAILKQVASSPVSVLLQGETGTGKEIVANAIHQLSGRPGPFTAINCGAIPEALVESELFGVKKGAYSGAVQDRKGLVRSSDGGTLFLDEIGSLPLSSQSKFLGVLQERQVVPVGGTRPIPVDIRVCAAAHRPLDALVRESKFREDLLARISGSVVTLPSLRNRREDLGVLIASILGRIGAERAEKVNFKKAVIHAFLAYAWPLNIRELEKCLEAALVLATDNSIGLQHLPAPIRAALTTEQSPSAGKKLTKEELADLLTRHRGNVHAISRQLGKDRVQIRRWLRRYQLDPKDFRSRS